MAFTAQPGAEYGQLTAVLQPLLRPSAPRRARTLKVYKKTYTGEVVETKGGNYKTLKEWKAKFGSDLSSPG